MQCPRCQAENDDAARFCEDCGAKLEVRCPSCGAAVTPGKRFCRACGAALPGEPARVAPPQAYIPKHLAERILTSKAALEGERKQVTVLFADLKGSMELLADRDPEEARKILDPVLGQMMEAVHRYDGTVNQVMGDGIMALFGAPLAHEDHAVRAGYAALRMQQTVKQYAEDVRRREGILIQIRVGLNSGEVVVRSIGSDLHMDYTAVGQTTHLAARMEQMAAPGSILMTAATLGLAEGYLQVGSLGALPVKGLESPVEVYEVTGAETLRSRLHAAAARGLTPFVGRGSELDQLRQALERAGSGQGQVVAVVGEPGVGKSRLFWEFTRSHRTQGWSVLAGGSVSYGKATAYLPVIDLLKVYARIEGRDDTRTIREKLIGKMLSLDRSLEPYLPPLLSLLDVPAEDAAWERLDPPQRGQRTREAVKRVLLRESQVQPLLLVFEDLHWIDAETQALLDSLMDSLPAARMLLLVNYRPEYRHGWGNKTYYRQLRVDPLPAEGARELLDGLLGTDASVSTLKALLIARTGGNPFFIEESVRTLVEVKALGGDKGAHALLRPTEAIQVPATVQAILAARIDRLSPEDKSLLQTAAVIGKDVPLSLLQPIAELPEEELRSGLARLQAGEFLYETQLFPEAEFTFKHALTHEVAYAGLLHDRRRHLHARIVTTIEALYADRLGEQLEQLAHHAVRGEVWDRAVGYLRQAGTRAFERSANAEAITRFSKGLEVVRTLTPSREQAREELQLYLALGPALQATKGFGAVEVEDAYTRAQQLCERVGDSRETFKALWGVWLLRTMQGKVQTGRRIGDKLLALAHRLGDPALVLEGHHALWASLSWLGEPVVAQEHLDKGMVLYDREQHRSHIFFYGGHDPGVCCRKFAGISSWVRGYPSRALESSIAGIALAEELSHGLTTALALVWGCAVRQFRGEVDVTRAQADAAIALSTEQGFPQWLAAGEIFAGWARAEQGEREAGIAGIRRGLHAYRTTGAQVWIPYFLSLLAVEYLQHGEPEAASDTIAESLDVAGRTGQYVWLAELHRLEGEIALARSPGDTAAAERCFREAIGVAVRQSARSWELRAVTSLARLLAREGRGAEARAMLGSTYEWFSEGFDTPDLQEARRVLAAL